MAKRNPIKSCCLSGKRQRELCLECKLDECNSASTRCAIRLEVNRLQREYYHKNKERKRSKNRKENIPNDQYEKKKEYNRRYYHENREVVLMKQKLKAESK